MKRLLLEEERTLATQRGRWEQIEQRLVRLVNWKRIKKNRGESIADEVKRLIGSRTDEQIQRVLYELESVEPA
jgi:hypothetical protein